MPSHCEGFSEAVIQVSYSFFQRVALRQRNAIVQLGFCLLEPACLIARLGQVLTSAMPLNLYIYLQRRNALNLHISIQRQGLDGNASSPISFTPFNHS